MNRSKCERSGADSRKLKRDLPKTEMVSPAHPVGKYRSLYSSKVKPKQAKALTNSMRPMCRKSKVNITELGQPELWSNIESSVCIASSKEILKPSRPNPRMDAENPK